MGISVPQLLLILVIVLLLFGAGRLPRVMSDLAKGVRAFKKGMEEDLPPIGSDSPLNATSYMPRLESSASSVKRLSSSKQPLKRKVSPSLKRKPSKQKGS